MPRYQKPDAKILPELLIYHADTGKLFWRKRSREFFKSDSSCARWNALHAWKEAFTSLHSEGYLQGSILCKNLIAHRVIIAMQIGEWPRCSVDHINGIKSDNRISNLRCVTDLENRQNLPLSKANKSGAIGVYFHKKRRKWTAQIRVRGEKIHLGIFQNKSEAIAARKDADKKYGFHPNHGGTAPAH